MSVGSADGEVASILGVDELALLTDLYQLTMMQAYFEHGQDGIAVFELVFRDLPPRRNFLLFAGLATLLPYLEQLRFTPKAIAELASTGRFHTRFLEHLEGWRFRGEIWALAEGTPFFPGEPAMQVIAPLGQAQLVETLVLNQIHFQTVVASKAARVVAAAHGKPVVDFGLRRTHGLDAGLLAARAAYLAGAQGTSNVLAALRFGIPVSGTMAHSAVEAFGDDLSAFRAFAETDPQTTLLVDTFDTLAGVDAVIQLRRELGDRFQVRAIRIDSGDLLELSREVRRRLDAAGLENVAIFASGGLDEDALLRLTAAHAPIDAFGVGTQMDVSGDAPALDCAFKLVEYGGLGRMKLSTGKATLPGRKQIFRSDDENGLVRSDVVALREELLPGRPLLQRVMAHGRALPEARRALRDLRSASLAAVAALPGALRSLSPAPAFPVTLSPRLAARRAELQARIRARLAGLRSARNHHG